MDAFPIYVIIPLQILALILSIGVHEFSHVLSAYVQGDQTGRLMGRLTLNPLKHLDPIGTLLMVMSVILGFGIGWGKPAPYNPNALRYRRWGPFLVAIAGPLSNIVLVALCGYALMLIGPHLPVGNVLVVFLYIMVMINAGLAMFNLLPIPPLDGSRILSAIFGARHPLIQLLDRYGFFLIILLLWVGKGFLDFWVTGGTHIILRLLGLA